MKVCPKCQNKYPDDANFCPREECASDQGPSRLEPIVEAAPARFVPVSRIGGGPSGEVWQANDAQSGGAVAYKLVAPAVLPSASSQERMQRELRQLQRVANPRVPKIVDFGQSPDGRFFIATELVGGEPLDQVVAQHGALPLDRAKRVIAQVGEALLEAQKVGIVHRDLAAKNVLVSGDDTVRVINFTVPRPLNDTVFGVPEFMSPEQAEGKLIDQRSNTYSLGSLLYFALTGQAPASGATPEAVLQAVQKGDITPPSILHGAGLTAEVDRVVMKALEKSSTRRPLTMRQFLADVAALVVTDEQRLSPPAAGKEPAFARTMMFAGGASEVQKLVAQALAARAAGEAPQNGAHEGTNVGMGPPSVAQPTEAPGAACCPRPRSPRPGAREPVTASAAPASGRGRGLGANAVAAQPSFTRRGRRQDDDRDARGGNASAGGNPGGQPGRVNAVGWRRDAGPTASHGDQPRDRRGGQFPRDTLVQKGRCRPNGRRCQGQDRRGAGCEGPGCRRRRRRHARGAGIARGCETARGPLRRRRHGDPRRSPEVLAGLGAGRPGAEVGPPSGRARRADERRRGA